jgi:hypothetical protein
MRYDDALYIFRRVLMLRHVNALGSIRILFLIHVISNTCMYVELSVAQSVE